MSDMSKATIVLADIPGKAEVSVRLEFEPGIGGSKELKYLSHYLATIATDSVQKKLETMGAQVAKPSKPKLV